MSKKDLLKKLQEELVDCKGCGLEGKGYPVFSGIAEQKVMLIGYKPSDKHPDLLSHEKIIPIITSVLSKIPDSKEYGAYITYLLRCFVPDSYYTPDIVDICKEYLKKEIDIVKPEHIIIIGEETIKSLLLSFNNEEEIDGEVLGHKCKVYFIAL